MGGVVVVLSKRVDSSDYHSQWICLLAHVGVFVRSSLIFNPWMSCKINLGKISPTDVASDSTDGEHQIMAGLFPLAM